MNEECPLRPGARLELSEVVKIAVGLKSLAAYSMLAYDHEDDPDDLQQVVDEGLEAIQKLFDC